jgi:hypothetical protein
LDAKVAYSAILDKFLRLLANIAQLPTRKRVAGLGQETEKGAK